jgi:hypothetical protein
MYSIYHFFKHLVTNKRFFETITNIGEFPFDADMLSCQNAGQFPDLAIKINTSDTLFTGGELKLLYFLQALCVGQGATLSLPK